tara:strand:+ start:980 stop:1363 length:384 start_codon:yes stop_codon:yes gene_type:complete
MSYVLGVILGLSLINTIFLVNNLKTHTENKKQLDNLYNFTIYNTELTNNNNNKKQDINHKKQDINHEKQDINNKKQDINNEKQESSINQIELCDSVSQGIPQWSFLNLGKTLKQKSKNSSLSLSKKE